MKLELTKRGDYAIRAMLALAADGAEQRTAAQLAAHARIPPSYVPQVMGDLVRAGLVANRRGRHGGYRLARNAGDIHLLAVVEAVEGDGRIRTCVLRGDACRRERACDVHAAFAQAQAAMSDALAAVSLADVTR